MDLTGRGRSSSGRLARARAGSSAATGFDTRGFIGRLALEIRFRRGTLARVTVEDCLENVHNRFALVILAAERARQLANGAKALVRCDNKPAVTSLREIAKSRVKFNESVENTVTQYLTEVKTRNLRADKSHTRHGGFSAPACGCWAA